MEEKILDMLKNINKEILSFDGDDLLDAGLLDSLDVADLISDIEDEFDIEINTEHNLLEHFKTKESIIALVKKFLDEKD